MRIWIYAVLLALMSGAAYGHAVFKPPRVFKKPNTVIDFDANPQARTFLAFAQRASNESVTSATALKAAISAFLDRPDQATLERARDAWRAARPAYSRSEVLRFFNGPVDHPGAEGVAPGPETRINAWPVNEASIDSVRGARQSGIVNNLEISLNRETLIALNQSSDEADITLGWHAIEFLLWGQDEDAAGPGARSYKDYLPGDALRERRRQYLKLATAQLVDDLAAVAQGWEREKEGSYAQLLRNEPALEVLGRSLHGAASLTAIEIYGERLTGPLDTRTQEDEHSCFSDNTLADLIANVEGVRFLVEGRYGGDKLGPSLLELLEWKDPQLARRLKSQLERTEAAFRAIRGRFDQIVVSASGDPHRREAEQAAQQAQALAVTLKAAAERLGIDIVVPGV